MTSQILSANPGKLKGNLKSHAPSLTTVITTVIIESTIESTLHYKSVSLMTVAKLGSYKLEKILEEAFTHLTNLW